jgi:3-oxoacyl-[acyl-carrier protein] reductase
MKNQPVTADLAGQCAVVTGSSSGIGRATALELAAAGAAVVVHARRNQSGAETVAAEIRARGGTAKVLLADLAVAAEAERFVESAWSWRGAIDVWFNNAGADTLTGESASWDFERKLAALWSVDVVATMRLSRAVGARMRALRSGTIINMGWDQAEQGMAGDSGELFAAVKGAVIAFTRSLAQSLAPHVRVNCVAPGWIRTAWGENASADWQARAHRESLLARWGTPEDVARAVRFLASPAAAFINGVVLPVNGGFRHGAPQAEPGSRTP